MSFKNGICASVHFTAIFQIIQSTREILWPLRKTVPRNSPFICRLWKKLWRDTLVTNLKYLAGRLIAPFLCIVTNIFRLQFINIIQHNHRHIVHIRAQNQNHFLHITVSSRLYYFFLTRIWIIASTNELLCSVCFYNFINCFHAKTKQAFTELI